MTTFAPKKKFAPTVLRALCSNVFAHPWGVMVQVFVPGCSRHDVQVRVHSGLLRVHAAPPPNPHALGSALLRERTHAEGERQFSLAPDLDFQSMTQSLHHGVLTITIPKFGSTAPNLLGN